MLPLWGNTKLKAIRNMRWCSNIPSLNIVHRRIITEGDAGSEASEVWIPWIIICSHEFVFIIKALLFVGMWVWHFSRRPNLFVDYFVANVVISFRQLIASFNGTYIWYDTSIGTKSAHIVRHNETTDVYLWIFPCMWRTNGWKDCVKAKATVTAAIRMKANQKKKKKKRKPKSLSHQPMNRINIKQRFLFIAVKLHRAPRLLQTHNGHLSVCVSDIQLSFARSFFVCGNIFSIEIQAKQ